MSKEKKPFQVRFSMRVFFTIFIVAERLVIYTVAGLLVALLGIFVPAVHRIPEMLWLLIISIDLGSAIARFIFRFFFQRCKDLGHAMGKVTAGHFRSGGAPYPGDGVAADYQHGAGQRHCPVYVPLFLPAD